MGIPAKDGNGADLTLASTATAEGELPSSTQADPTTGQPFKGASEDTLEAARALIAGLLTNAQLRASNVGVQLAALASQELH